MDEQRWREQLASAVLLNGELEEHVAQLSKQNTRTRKCDTPHPATACSPMTACYVPPGLY